MNDLVILGTDTDVGKTTFALLWMTHFADRYEYWKPIETGPSDSAAIARLVPDATVHPPLQRFDAPVAPPLAAQLAKQEIASTGAIAGARPPLTHPGRRLLLETFGSPFSPLNQRELQLTLIQLLGTPTVLISSSALGAIGRTLQCLTALAAHGIEPVAVVLIGADLQAATYAAATIEQQRRCPVFSVLVPATWDRDGLRQAADTHADILDAVARLPRACQVRGIEDPARLLTYDREIVWHPYTPLEGTDPPLVCNGAHAEFLELADGRRLIDGISSWWTILHGHRTAALVEALHVAAGQIDHVHFAGVTHPWGVEFGAALLRSVGWNDGRVFYSDNGSTAVEVALKLAYQFWCHHDEPRRTRFIGFEHGYHGDTFGSMGVSRDPLFFGRFEPLLFRADILPLDPNRLDERLRRTRDEVAAIIIEPLVQGAGGMRMHSPETLHAIAAVARQHDVLFIADEVMTGGGRTGTRWAHQAADVSPDLICTAKTLAGGMLPLAATLVAPRIVAAFATADRTRTFFHGHSFTAHPLACAVACASETLLARSVPDKPRSMEAFWTQALMPLRGVSQVKDVRIRGSIAAVELDVPGGYLADIGRTMRLKALEMGVLLRPLGAVLYAMPPFCTSAESLRRIADAMHAAVKAAVA